MNNRSFKENIMLERGAVIIHDLSALNEQGKRQWYIIKMTKQQEVVFLKALSENTGNIDISDYGEVLESGFGDKAPKEIFYKYKEEYST